MAQAYIYSGNLEAQSAGGVVYKFGHRGAPGSTRYGENTVHSFEEALKRGANALELDVRRCGSGEIVVIHDARMNRTTNGRGLVKNLAYSEIRKFDAGFGEPVPLLADVLNIFGGRCFLNVELKETGLTEDISVMVLERGLKEQVILSAFDADDNWRGKASWKELASLVPKLQIALLATKRKIRRLGVKGLVSAAVRCGATAIDSDHRGTTPQLVAEAHRNSLKVNVWTVNDPAEIARFKAMYVDGIFSDFPERL